MSFEEDFPSLHLKTWIIGLETDVTSGTIYGQRSVLKGDDSGKYIKKIDVMTNCLDKQRVKKVILNALNNPSIYEPSTTIPGGDYNEELCDYLLNELRLEQ